MSNFSDHHPGEILEPGTVYSIETVERITHISRDRIIFYQREGLVSPVEKPEAEQPVFDEQAVHRLRRIAFLLSEYGMNHPGLKMVSSLMDELERLREEVRFLREKE